MIRILGRLFWNIVRTRLAGPVGADAPILIVVIDTDMECGVPSQNPKPFIKPVGAK